MKGVPQPTIQRLVSYYRYLRKLTKIDEKEVICSKKLGKEVGTSSAQVRKDLSYFGEFGCKGVGYDVQSLKNSLEKILGLEKEWSAILVGAGNLGRALVNYQGFKKMGLNIVGVFDCDLNKIGNRVGDLVVKSDREILSVVEKEKAKIGILAIPDSEAQTVAEQLVEAGIKAIWNFAPIPLRLADDVIIYYEDLASSIVTLIYHLNDVRQNERSYRELNKPLESGLEENA